MDDKPHLLLVDDERSIREPLATYLGRNGFRVTQAGDAAAARDRLKAAQEFVARGAARTSIDHQEASIVDARARTVDTLLREQQAEPPLR